MSGIVEDIGGGGIDWDGSSICGRIRGLSYKLSDSYIGAQSIVTHIPACNCKVSKRRESAMTYGKQCQGREREKMGVSGFGVNMAQTHI